MSFDVGAGAYLRFMGTYSEPLAKSFADLAGVTSGRSALDVGCGPGALTAELVRRRGSASVSAVDPSASFVAAARERLPGVDIRRASAEQLPFPDGVFDVVLAQLVIHFVADPVAGLREMGRVARTGGTVASCVWDYAGGRGPTSVFWRAVRDLDPSARNESGLAGTSQGSLGELFDRAGLGEARETVLTVRAEFSSFQQWWEPYTIGVGPAGAYVAALTEQDRAALRDHCRQLLPIGPIRVEASAWAAACKV